jgi:tRNA (guanine37-N1)-methyltransferase
LTVVDEELSIGDFVLAGGELPAMMLVEAVSRQIPGVVGDPCSVEQDSFRDGLLDYPHYTRPLEVEGLEVPAVLLSGHHREIARWRQGEALRATLEKRPDLLAARSLSEEEWGLLDAVVAKRPELRERLESLPSKSDNSVFAGKRPDGVGGG